LRRPVVDVPVVFVKEAVVGEELGECHGREVAVGEGGHEEVRFEGSALATLVWRGVLVVLYLEIYDSRRVHRDM